MNSSRCIAIGGSRSTAKLVAADVGLFTRLGTRHSHQEVHAAFEATPDTDQTFCLSVNNVILLFSTSRDEHIAQVRKIIQMLRDHSMRADISDCVFDAERSSNADIRLEQVAHGEVYLVINDGVPTRS